MSGESQWNEETVPHFFLSMLTAMRHDMAELVDVDPESNTNRSYNEIYYASLGKMKKKTRLLRACEQVYIYFSSPCFT